MDRAGALGHFEVHAVDAFPVDGLGIGLIAQGVDFYPVGNHKHRIESQTEMADDVGFFFTLFPLIILQEFFRAGEGHLVDITADFLIGHANARIGNADLALLLVHGNGNAHVLLCAQVEHAVLGNGVTAVGNNLTQENIFVRVKPAFNHRHNILRFNGYAALFNGHGINPPCCNARR